MIDRNDTRTLDLFSGLPQLSKERKARAKASAAGSQWRSVARMVASRKVKGVAA